MNQLANALVGESHLSKAAQQYQEALVLMGSRFDGVSIPPKISCAYCLIVLGQVHAGMGQLFACLRHLKRSDALPIMQAWAHLFLCCGYQELGRTRRAWLHGMRARELAEETGDYDAIKSALFMLGEVERCGGDSESAYAWFREMQQRFYPENPEMPVLMAHVGMTRVVNLRA
jgi:tetratricopeptide (TPR) repeat protein